MNVEVSKDSNAALGLDISQAVYTNETSILVNVTNDLGHDVTVTVTVHNDSTAKGDLVVDGTNYGDEASFAVTQGGNETVRIKIPDDSSLTDEVVYFHVKASGSGLTAKARNRSAPIDA